MEIHLFWCLKCCNVYNWYIQAGSFWKEIHGCSLSAVIFQNNRWLSSDIIVASITTIISTIRFSTGHTSNISGRQLNINSVTLERVNFDIGYSRFYQFDNANWNYNTADLKIRNLIHDLWNFDIWYADIDILISNHLLSRAPLVL